MKNMYEHSLYLLITEEYCRGRSALEIAGCAIAGGVDLIQLRDKSGRPDAIIAKAKKLAALCKEKGAKFIINDDPVIARDADADGVHLGQEDLRRFTVKFAREILGEKKIIGISTSSLEEVERADSEDVDYIGFGPVFQTAIKDVCVGIKDVEKVLKISKKPVFFIGGICLENIDELLSKGARNIAVIRAITEVDDIETAARKLKNKIEGKNYGKAA